MLAPTVDLWDFGVGSLLADVFTRAHNEIRAEAPSATPPLNPIGWHDDLAAEAQAWADLCFFEHDPLRGSVGENLFFSTSSLNVEVAAMQAWASERPFYNELTGDYEDGAVCGHYTQIVS